MESLGGILAGNAEAREILSTDLQAAAAPGPDGKPRKSWKKPPLRGVPDQLGSLSTEFSSHKVINSPPQLPPYLDPSLPQHQQTPSLSSHPWFAENGFNQPSGSGGFSPSAGMPPVFFDNSGPRTTADHAGDSDGGSSTRPSQAQEGVSPPNFFTGGSDIPVRSTSSSVAPYPVHPRPSTLVALAEAASLSSTSPRQRRKIELQTPELLNLPSSNPNSLSIFQGSLKPGLAANAINHTGQATYILSPGADTDLHPPEEGQLSELADVIGQLSLNENAEVRYHGRWVFFSRWLV